MQVKRLSARDVTKAPLAIGSSYYIMEAGGAESMVGFGVRIGRRTKQYVVRYRRRPYIIGRADLLLIEVAREKARQTLLRLVGGEQVVTGTKTVKQLRDAYMERHARSKKAERSADDDERMWDQRILPFQLEDGRKLGELRVGEATADHVSQLHVALQATPFLANRCLSLLSHAFNLAATWRWRDARDPNPTRGIQRYPERTRRERHYSDAEFRAWGEAIAAAYAGDELSPVAVACCELLVYTGARPGEVMALDWSWLNAAERRFRLPRAKGDRAAGDEAGRDVWLSEQALDVLRRMARAQKHDRPGFPAAGPVFPGRDKTKPIATIQKPWAALCKVAKIEGATPKTLRHSFITEGQLAGVALEGMADLAGHSDTDTTDRSYRARVADVNRANVDRMGVHLERKMNAPAAEGVN